MIFGTPPWRVVGASVVGTSHRASGAGCADAHAYRQRADGTLIVAVADGAGSAPRAAEGAQAAVAAATAAIDATLDAWLFPPLLNSDWEALLDNALMAARGTLDRLAATGSLAANGSGTPAIGDFATTLLLAAVTSSTLAVAQIGDGAVVVQDGFGAITAVTRPDHGEYLNETIFLTSANYREQAQFAILTPPLLQGLAVLTDGVQMLALNLADYTPHPPFFAPLFAFAAGPEAVPSALAAFLDSERVCARTDDDKTLVLAVRR